MAERESGAVTDVELIEAMLGTDTAIAKRIYDERHVADSQPKDPAHCAECFEGCPKCQGGM